MKVHSKLVDKLSILKEIYPINGAIQIGVNESIVNRCIDLNIEKVFFVEADGKVVDKLKPKIQHRDWLIREKVVAKDNQERSFYYANNPKHNGLVEIESLKKYWRNLKIAHVNSVKTVNLDELMASLKQNANWLTIDCLPAVEVLKGYVDRLSELDVIVIKAILDKPDDSLLNSTVSEADDFLATFGFESISIDDDLNPNIGHVIYIRKHQSKEPNSLVSQDVFNTLEQKYKQLVENTANQNKTIEAQQFDLQNSLEAQEKLNILLEEMQTALEEKIAEVERLEQVRQENQTCSKQLALLATNKLSLEEKIATVEFNLDDLKVENSRLNKVVTDLSLENTELKKQLESSYKVAEQLSSQNQTLSQLAENQQKMFSSLENNIVNKFQTGLLNSVKQIESYIGVQNYLETGNLAMDYHGWPISSDIALFLLNKIERNNYDLIIEFGSGTSTLLFAKALKNKQQHKLQNSAPRLESVEVLNDNTPGKYLDLPKQIVTFEHNKKYFEKTMTSLTDAGVNELVDLIHAPLVDCRVNGQDFLYYSCESMLNQLKHVFAGRVAKVLVLIDGPPAKTGPLARLPGVPLLLNYLANHQLDIVLDDFNRQEEKDIVQSWKKVFDDRFISYEEEEVMCEKGAYFCRINP
ncbi:hypothetical protein QWY77_03405 [Thalassotalea ponticola]|uniref:hypothetical protein n=1 Tax=Thalassotalea ponticola TaxID=1523392 RepID=UPI0025B4A9E8|nr:hypothetical protein [Thalassotalea ponticola]MDN3651812.1 hypothetical protein [Thalassotalea ponticola]